MWPTPARLHGAIFQKTLIFQLQRAFTEEHPRKLSSLFHYNFYRCFGGIGKGEGSLLKRYWSQTGAEAAQSVSVWLQTGRPGYPLRSQAEAKGFLLASVSRPVLRPIQPPIQRIQGVLSPGIKGGRCVTLTTHIIYIRCQEYVDLYFLSHLSAAWR
jgi:hypothetical protein